MSMTGNRLETEAWFTLPQGAAGSLMGLLGNVLTPNTLLAFCRVNAMHLVDKLRLAYEYVYLYIAPVAPHYACCFSGEVSACLGPYICNEHWCGWPTTVVCISHQIIRVASRKGLCMSRPVYMQRALDGPGVPEGRGSGGAGMGPQRPRQRPGRS
jgi:hypothetical protein